jgi:hypothetical protein
MNVRQNVPARLLTSTALAAACGAAWAQASSPPTEPQQVKIIGACVCRSMPPMTRPSSLQSNWKA